MSKEKCKICNSDVSVFVLHGNMDAQGMQCPLCGDYAITNSAFMSGFDPNVDDYEKVLFSGYLRNSSRMDSLITVDSAMLKNVKELVAPYKQLSMDERIDLIVSYAAKGTKQIGNPVNLHNAQSAFYLRNEGELYSVVDWLEKMGLGKRSGAGFILGIDGWRRYEKSKEININSKKVFVAMNFKKELDYIFSDAVEPACDECGFYAIRVDAVEHNQKICDKIISEIRSSRFLVADFTEQRYGVYFEAGYAYGLGLPVIWTCKKGDEDKLHFDTRQYNHIIWEDAKDLKEKLVNRIKATIK